MPVEFLTDSQAAAYAAYDGAPSGAKTTEAAEICDALHLGRTIRRGQGYWVRVTTPLALHQATLKQCAALADDGAAPAGRTAYRTYADRIAATTVKK